MGLAAGESVCYIGCHLLESSGGDWGYKSLDESVHPYYYSCPLRYLDMAPVQSSEWRERVHRFHAGRARHASSFTQPGEHGPAGCGCSFFPRGHHHACTFFRETAVPHRRMPRPHGRRLRR